MSKSITIGSVRMPKPKPGETKEERELRIEKRYFSISKGVTLVVRGKDGSEVTLPEGSYISMFKPKQFPKETNEQFAERKELQRFELVAFLE